MISSQIVKIQITTDMNKIIRIILLITALLPCTLYAQNTIKGTVKDNMGGVPGVSVVEKGDKANGTQTDESGNFSITLKNNTNILIISAIGFLKQEVNVAGKNNITISLKEDAKGLD